MTRLRLPLLVVATPSLAELLACRSSHAGVCHLCLFHSAKARFAPGDHALVTSGEMINTIAEVLEVNGEIVQLKTDALEVGRAIPLPGGVFFF